MRRSFGKSARLALVLATAAMLSGCTPDGAREVLEQARKGASELVERIVSYDYSGFWHSLASAFKTARRDRYSERQSLVLEVPKETQLAVYTNILNDCQGGCEVIERGYVRNTAYAGNDTANLKLAMPSAEAGAFINLILKHGNVVKNSFAADEYVAKDMAYYTAELTALGELRLKLEEGLALGGTHELERVREVQAELAKIREKIAYIENDVEYLNRIKGRRMVEISIARETNSVAAKVKSNLQNLYSSAGGYIHYLIVAAVLFLIWRLWKLVRWTARKIAAGAAERRLRKALSAPPKKTVKDMEPEPKLQPKL
ncbi:MAG: DUF4349 domain-containing protein [Rickettsiales bacterium]|jgi:hypothetical protein|nr:DUF4349 domain-containing protein [Rickettsiales bacterium]